MLFNNLEFIADDGCTLVGYLSQTYWFWHFILITFTTKLGLLLAIQLIKSNSTKQYLAQKFCCKFLFYCIIGTAFEYFSSNSQYIMQVVRFSHFSMNDIFQYISIKIKKYQFIFDKQWEVNLLVSRQVLHHMLQYYIFKLHKYFALMT